MLSILIVVGIAFLLQGLLGFFQMRHLTNEFLKLRRKGKVAFGRKSGGFRAGAVVMFLIDEDGIIWEGKKLEGTTAFARVRPLEGFEGRYVGSLKKEDGPARHKNLQQPRAPSRKWSSQSQACSTEQEKKLLPGKAAKDQ